MLSDTYHRFSLIGVKSELDENAKWTICRKIFYASHNRYSKADTEILVNPEKVKGPLKDKQYKTIFRQLFERQVKMTIPVVNKQIKIRGFRHRYVNSSRAREIFINGNKYLEPLFSCIVQNEQSMKITVFYVSDYDYNVNDAPVGDYIAGRFVFAHDDQFLLRPYALVEEPVSPTFLQSVAEKYYQSKRKVHSPGRS